MWFALFMGSILYLMLEQPLVFWLVVLPLTVIAVIKFITWFNT